MRKSVLVGILLVALAVPVYASSFGDSLSGSGNWGLKVANALKGGKGLYGQSTNTEGGGSGVYGVSTGRTGRGVYGLASRGGGKSIGVFGESKSNQGKGVMGFASKASGTTYGVYGRANSPDGWGVYTPNKAYVGGRLGIGTTSPGAKLDVNGNVQLPINQKIGTRLGNPGTNGYFIPYDIAGRTVIWNTYGLSQGILFGTANTERMRITKDGNVGIGDTTPAQRLEVSNIMRLTPTDDVPACTSSTKGSIYYDNSLSELCDCNGIGWSQVDGGGTCEPF
jgi:hypothetical protein